MRQFPESTSVTTSRDSELPEDLEITKITNQLAGKLGLTDYPLRMRWKSTYWVYMAKKIIDHAPVTFGTRNGPYEMPVDPAYPIVIDRTMLISDLLHGRGITSEEWAPIIASPLVYNSRLKSTRVIGGLWRGILAFATLALMIQGVGPVPSVLRVQSLISISWTLGLATVLSLLTISARRFFRRMVFLADSIVVGLLGQEETLNGLSKLESLRQHDEQSNVKWTTSSLASIAKRIAHLKNAQS